MKYLFLLDFEDGLILTLLASVSPQISTHNRKRNMAAFFFFHRHIDFVRGNKGRWRGAETLGEESMPFSPGRLLHNAQNGKLNFFYPQIFQFHCQISV